MATGVDDSVTETTLAVLNETADGRFSGAVMPMAAPLDSRSQWQHLIDGLLSHVVRVDKDAQLDGLYSFTWWADVNAGRDAGLILTRITDNSFDLGPETLPCREGLLGLMLVTTDTRTLARIAVLALRGYGSAKGAPRPDRVFVSFVDSRGQVGPAPIDKQQRRSLNLMGRELLTIIDKQAPGRD